MPRPCLRPASSPGATRTRGGPGEALRIVAMAEWDAGHVEDRLAAVEPVRVALPRPDCPRRRLCRVQHRPVRRAHGQTHSGCSGTIGPPSMSSALAATAYRRGSRPTRPRGCRRARAREGRYALAGYWKTKSGRLRTSTRLNEEVNGMGTTPARYMWIGLGGRLRGRAARGRAGGGAAAAGRARGTGPKAVRPRVHRQARVACTRSPRPRRDGRHEQRGAPRAARAQARRVPAGTQRARHGGPRQSSRRPCGRRLGSTRTGPTPMAPPNSTSSEAHGRRSG